MLPCLEFIFFSSMLSTVLVLVLACGMVQKPSGTGFFFLLSERRIFFLHVTLPELYNMPPEVFSNRRLALIA